jgi:flagellar biosynthesis chaperone FliJ
MIANDVELNNTQEKLQRLEDRARKVEERLRRNPDRSATRVTLLSYRQLIGQLQEEIRRYELGVESPQRRLLQNEEELQNTIAKLESLKRLEEKRAAEPPSSARNVSLLSLRRTMNQLREEIAWYETHRAQPVDSATT